MAPVFQKTGEYRPVAFRFYTTKESEKDFRYGWGWMIATINDRTGELLISSDWGHWVHRWNIDHLGPSHWNPYRPSSLMEFIGSYDARYSNEKPEWRYGYLAGKLSTPEEKRVFDPEKTVKEWRRQIIEMRRDGYPTKFTREVARNLWDELDELESVEDVRDFVDAFYRIEGHNMLSDTPWDDLMHSHSGKYEVLLRAVLPAVCGAAFEYAVKMQPKPPPLGWSADADAQCPLWDGLKVRKVMYA